MKDQIVGKIRLTEKGKIEIGEWYKLTYGEIFEININGTWVKTQLAGSKGCLYAYGLKGLDLRGRLARVSIAG